MTTKDQPIDETPAGSKAKRLEETAKEIEKNKKAKIALAKKLNMSAQEMLDAGIIDKIEEAEDATNPEEKDKTKEPPKQEEPKIDDNAQQPPVDPALEVKKLEGLLVSKRADYLKSFREHKTIDSVKNRILKKLGVGKKDEKGNNELAQKTKERNDLQKEYDNARYALNAKRLEAKRAELVALNKTPEEIKTELANLRADFVIEGHNELKMMNEARVQAEGTEMEELWKKTKALAMPPLGAIVSGFKWLGDWGVGGKVRGKNFEKPEDMLKKADALTAQATIETNKKVQKAMLAEAEKLRDEAEKGKIIYDYKVGQSVRTAGMVALGALGGSLIAGGAVGLTLSLVGIKVARSIITAAGGATALYNIDKKYAKIFAEREAEKQALAEDFKNNGGDEREYDEKLSKIESRIAKHRARQKGWKIVTMGVMGASAVAAGNWNPHVLGHDLHLGQGWDKALDQNLFGGSGAPTVAPDQITQNPAPVPTHTPEPTTGTQPESFGEKSQGWFRKLGRFFTGDPTRHSWSAPKIEQVTDTTPTSNPTPDLNAKPMFDNPFNQNNINDTSISKLGPYYGDGHVPVPPPTNINPVDSVNNNVTNDFHSSKDDELVTPYANNTGHYGGNPIKDTADAPVSFKPPVTTTPGDSVNNNTGIKNPTIIKNPSIIKTPGDSATTPADTGTAKVPAGKIAPGQNPMEGTTSGTGTTPTPENPETASTPEKSGANDVPEVEDVPKITDPHPVEVKASTQGALQTVKDLKKLLIEKYPDPSKAPDNIQKILGMKGHIQLTKDFKMWIPDAKEESAMNLVGTTITEENGVITLHDLGKGDTVLSAPSDYTAGKVEAYHGKMFHYTGNDAPNGGAADGTKPGSLKFDETKGPLGGPEPDKAGLDPRKPVDQEAPYDVNKLKFDETEGPLGGASKTGSFDETEGPLGGDNYYEDLTTTGLHDHGPNPGDGGGNGKSSLSWRNDTPTPPDNTPSGTGHTMGTGHQMGTGGVVDNTPANEPIYPRARNMGHGHVPGTVYPKAPNMGNVPGNRPSGQWQGPGQTGVEYPNGGQYPNGQYPNGQYPNQEGQYPNGQYPQAPELTPEDIASAERVRVNNAADAIFGEDKFGRHIQGTDTNEWKRLKGWKMDRIMDKDHWFPLANRNDAEQIKYLVDQTGISLRTPEGKMRTLQEYLAEVEKLGQRLSPDLGSHQSYAAHLLKIKSIRDR